MDEPQQTMAELQALREWAYKRCQELLDSGALPRWSAQHADRPVLVCMRQNEQNQMEAYMWEEAQQMSEQKAHLFDFMPCLMQPHKDITGHYWTLQVSMPLALVNPPQHLRFTQEENHELVSSPLHAATWLEALLQGTLWLESNFLPPTPPTEVLQPC